MCSKQSGQLGVWVIDSESTRQLARYSKEVIKTSAAFQRYLCCTGESLANELLVGKSGRGIPGAMSFFRDFPKRWAAKTDCQAGYVVPGCKQYKGQRHLRRVD